MAELSLLTDKEKELQYELRQTEEALREEKHRNDRLLDQVSSVWLPVSRSALDNSSLAVDTQFCI